MLPDTPHDPPEDVPPPSRPTPAPDPIPPRHPQYFRSYDVTGPEKLAQRFYEKTERMATAFGIPFSGVPWREVKSNQRAILIAAFEELLDEGIDP